MFSVTYQKAISSALNQGGANRAHQQVRKLLGARDFDAEVNADHQRQLAGFQAGSTCISDF